MGNNFRNDNPRGRSFDRGGFGRRNDNRGGSRGGDRQMFKATCANCGKACEVPFRPTNSKPVYCSECFEKMGGGGRNERQNDRPRFNDRRPQREGGFDQNSSQFESLNNKLDRIIKLLEPKAEAVEVVRPQEEVKPEPETPKEVLKVEAKAKEVKANKSPKAKRASKKATPKT